MFILPVFGCLKMAAPRFAEADATPSSISSMSRSAPAARFAAGVLHRASVVARFCQPVCVLVYKTLCGKYQNTDPHIDHDFNHKILMMYLNNTSGDTIIYNKKFYPGGLTILPIDETSKRPMKELKRVSPELGKVMCVDGKHFHAGSFPEPGDRRVVVVFTFI